MRISPTAWPTPVRLNWHPLSTDENVAEEVDLGPSSASKIAVRSDQPTVEQEQAVEFFRLVVESAPNGILVADEEGQIILSNPRLRTVFGYSEEEFRTIRVEDLIPKEIRERHAVHREHYSHAPVARSMGAGRDLRAVRKNGEVFPVEVGLTPMPTDKGMLTVATVVDITARKQAEDAMRRTADVLANVHDAVFIVSPSGVIRTWNQGAEAVYGYSQEEAIGANVRLILPEEDQGRFENRTWPNVHQHERYDFVTWSLHRSGKKIAVTVRASLLRDALGQPDGVVICANDISEQKHLEQQLVQISENEQRRIGQDIHDDLCQQLASIGCLVKVLEQQLQEKEPSGAESLAGIGEMISSANVRAREIARGLVPAILESEGLEGALEALTAQSARVYGLEVTFECPDPVFLEDENHSVQLYRIAQEALSNAVRHGKPTAIALSLKMKDGHLVLSVSDNGQGMKENTEGGLGLLTMAHRAQLLGGELDIHTAAGQGTRVTCSFIHDNE